MNKVKVEIVIVIYTVRFNNIIVGSYIMTAVIHPICAMEEYAIIFRSCVWLSPPQPPTIIDRRDMESSMSRLIEGKIW